MIDTGNSIGNEGSEMPDKTAEREKIIKKWVNQTKYGLVFFASGIGMLWIPYVYYLGYLLCLVGIVGLIMGRKAFDEKHGIFLTASIVIFVFSKLIGLDVEVDMINSIANSTLIASSVLPVIRNHFIAILVVSYLGSVSYILPAWKLSRKLEKIIFVVGLFVGIIVSIVIYTLMFPTLSIDVSIFLVNHNAYELNDTLHYFLSLGLLNGIWYMILVGAFWLIYDDIDKGRVKIAKELPEND